VIQCHPLKVCCSSSSHSNESYHELLSQILVPTTHRISHKPIVGSLSMRHGGKCCSILQHITAYYSILQHITACCSMLQHVAACCSMLQYVAVCCSVLQCAAGEEALFRQSIYRTHNALQHTATHCNTLQHTATHCNTLQHTATHFNTLQHTVTR